MNKVFSLFLMVALILGGSLGGAFAGGVALGKTQSEEPGGAQRSGNFSQGQAGRPEGGSREPDRVARDKEAVKALDPERAANNGPVKAGLTLADHVLTVTGARGLMEVVEPEKAQKAVTGVAEVAGVE